MSIRHIDPVPSKACRECGGTGTLWDWDCDGSAFRIPCPACQPNPERARLAREFGTDRQRAEIGRRSRAIPMRSPR